MTAGLPAAAAAAPLIRTFPRIPRESVCFSLETKARLQMCNTRQGQLRAHCNGREAEALIRIRPAQEYGIFSLLKCPFSVTRVPKVSLL